MRRWPIVLAATLLSFADARTQTPSRTALDVFFIDVEGGQATLFVTPAGESMLVDAGWAGFEGRDAGRIEAAAKQAGVSRLDYLLVTHYHADHVGGVPEIARRLPVRTFVDHGATVEQGERPAALFNAYVDATASGKRLQVKPGDTLPLSGVDVRVVSSGGDLLNRPLPGAGAPNPLCRDFKPFEEDKTENARSVGVVLTYGNFRMIDIGDLTWNKEFELACPNNKVGTVDLYLTTHHGMNISNAPALVHALHARVAVMNNGARKGGTPEAWQTVHTSAGAPDIWQVHYAMEGGHDYNSPEALIANVYEKGDEGNWIRVSATEDGTITVYNSRNKYQKTYPK